MSLIINFFYLEKKTKLKFRDVIAPFSVAISECHVIFEEFGHFGIHFVCVVLRLFPADMAVASLLTALCVIHATHANSSIKGSVMRTFMFNVIFILLDVDRFELLPLFDIVKISLTSFLICGVHRDVQNQDIDDLSLFNANMTSKISLTRITHIQRQRRDLRDRKPLFFIDLFHSFFLFSDGIDYVFNLIIEIQIIRRGKLVK
jgi:hypothetical protein